MPHIQQLSPHVADLIAAGEVVERPASVVKELCENAVDAGAHAVTVEIANGGMTLIRVTDNGCGISPAEAPTAFLRHATSKIRSEYDLEAISTLGFRGEALAAIAAVARVELLTRRQEDPLGTSLALEGGDLLGQEEAGCPMGTTMLVRDLFYNTPARLKFMKKDAAEGAACLAVVQRQALSHPEVSFKFIRDGKQELLTPGDGSLKSALYAVLGRDLALGFVPVEGSGEDMSVSGFVSLPTCCRGTRGSQFFFVNGRYIKSQTMTAALEQAYANQKMVGKFPGCVLHLTVKLNQVDVNVHPTKQEVKFGAERAVFSAVYYAVLSALGGDKSHPAVQMETLRPKVEQGVQTSLPLHDFTNKGTERTAPAVPPNRPPVIGAPPKAENPIPSTPAEESLPPCGGKVSPKGTDEEACGREASFPGGTLIREPAADSCLGFDLVKSEDACHRHAPTLEGGSLKDPVTPVPVRSEATSPREESPAPAMEDMEGQETPWIIAGELFHTYILVEQGDKAFLIDKHAAHERMNFDRLRAVDYTPMSQTLISPLIFSPAPEEAATLLEHAAELEQIGFDLSDFGGGALAVRCVPDYVELGEAEAVLTEIAGKLTLTGTTGERERMDELYHTMACKAAIKGGWKNSREELEAVARAVMAGEVKYCPHGRPVAIELTQVQLEKQFKRRV